MEGDVFGHPEPIRPTAVLSLTAPSEAVVLGTVQVDQFTQTTTPARRDRPGETEVTFRLRALGGDDLTLREARRIEPRLLTSRQEEITLSLRSVRQEIRNGRTEARVRLTAATAGSPADPPALLELALNSPPSDPPQRLFRFRFTNVALPEYRPDPFRLRAAQPPPFLLGRGSRDRQPPPHALSRTGGGTVVVRVTPLPAPEQRRLLLGFAPVRDSSHNPAPTGYRWIEVTLDDRGEGVVTEVAPGRYRVMHLLPTVTRRTAALRPREQQNGGVIRVQAGATLHLSVVSGEQSEEL
ncbi:MAG: hypothetical protein FJX77_10915 [Armatimonadetes bacterium]|nr:hypothetical protein [Armatimonadota bacterium]